jgi:penicillin V acylase-like amidase (Ntn superfamily)
MGTADGLNERGLAAHMLYFNECDFNSRNVSKPGVQAGL